MKGNESTTQQVKKVFGKAYEDVLSISTVAYVEQGGDRSKTAWTFSR